MNVSVLLATYNGAAYLREQLDSLLRQTHADFRLYVSDDGSQDQTVRILEAYRAEHPGKIRLSRRNTGSAKENFLRLLEEAEGDLYFFCDQDDVWTDDHIETFVTRYAALPGGQQERPVLMHSDLAVTDGALNVVSESFIAHAGLPENPGRHFYFVGNNATGCATMINDALKRLVLRDAGELHRNMGSVIMHDHLLAAAAAEFGTKIFIRQATVRYRQHGKNTLGAGEERTAGRLLRKMLSPAQYRTSLAHNRSDCTKYRNFSAFFADYFGAFLDARERDLLSKFAGLNRKSRLRKIAFLVRNGFLPAGIVRKLWLFVAL